MLYWTECVGLIAVMRMGSFRGKDMGWDWRGSKIETRWTREVNVNVVKFILRGRRAMISSKPILGRKAMKPENAFVFSLIVDFIIRQKSNGRARFSEALKKSCFKTLVWVTQKIGPERDTLSVHYPLVQVCALHHSCKAQLMDPASEVLPH